MQSHFKDYIFHFIALQKVNMQWKQTNRTIQFRQIRRAKTHLRISRTLQYLAPPVVDKSLTCNVYDEAKRVAGPGARGTARIQARVFRGGVADL